MQTQVWDTIQVDGGSETEPHPLRWTSHSPASVFFLAGFHEIPWGYPILLTLSFAQNIAKYIFLLPSAMQCAFYLYWVKNASFV